MKVSDGELTHTNTPELRSIVRRFRLSTPIHLPNGRKHNSYIFGLALASLIGNVEDFDQRRPDQTPADLRG